LSDSNHPTGGAANGDWWELTNKGSSSITPGTTLEAFPASPSSRRSPRRSSIRMSRSSSWMNQRRILMA
jgi:hypothetical protein